MIIVNPDDTICYSKNTYKLFYSSRKIIILAYITSRPIVYLNYINLNKSKSLKNVYFPLITKNKNLYIFILEYKIVKTFIYV